MRGWTRFAGHACLDGVQRDWIPRLFGIVTWLLLAFAAALTLIPLAWLAAASFKQREDFFSSLFLPTGEGALGVAWGRMTFDHYERLFAELNFGTHLVNSLFYASTVAVVGTLLCAMAGYALAKLRFRGNRFCTGLVLVALVIPGPLLLAPGYQWIWQLGLLDTFRGLMLPGLVAPFGVFLFRQSMINAVPNDLLEAARIDGCGEWRTFFTMVLPLVRPTVGAFLLISFLAAWNNFIGPQIILQSTEKFPLAVAIAQLRGTYSQDYGMLMAGTMISVLPVMALFLALQREFISGLAAGAVKQ